MVTAADRSLSDLRLILLLKSMSQVLAGIAVVIGCLVIVGWTLDNPMLKSGIPGFVAMKANTAIAFVLTGLSLWLWHGSQADAGLRRVAQACVLFAVLLGLINLGEYMLGRDLGIDQLLFNDPAAEPVPPGRMAVTTALSFALVGCALLLLSLNSRHVLAQLFALVTTLLSFLSLVGYAYSVEALYSFGPYSAMAMPTALAFVALGAGTLFACPDRGLMSVATGNTTGGLMVRLLLPAVILVPPALGWAAILGEEAGWWDDGFAHSLAAVLDVVVFAILVGFSASALHSLDLRRKLAEEELRQAHEELELRVRERTAELRAANEQLDRFFTLSLDLMCIAGLDGYFKRINKAFEKTFGYTHAELLATPFIEFVHPDDRAATIAEVERLATGATALFFENRYQCKDGSYKWLTWTAVPEASTKLIYAVARDTTEQKRVEAEIKKLNEELERRVTERTAQLQAANKELEAFAYSVSHDLRAPLRHIDGFSQALLEDYAEKLDSEGQEYLRFVREGTQTMSRLIDDLLKLSRVTRVEMTRRRVDLSAVAQSIFDNLRRQEPERQVDFSISPEIVAVGAPDLLRLVLENLLGNAWKFTSKRQVARIEFGVVQQDGKTVYYVRDNGTGFDMAYANKLFGAFQRLHTLEEFPGTGIGLATVQRIVHRHGGRVWAEGALDKGAAFYFTLD